MAQVKQTQQDIPTITGLSEAEAQSRRAKGEGNVIISRTTRTYRKILQTNLFTFINIVLFIIGGLMVSLGLYSDALITVGVAFLSVLINVVQEFRAKYQLDKISLLARPQATILRDGKEKQVNPADIVRGDVIVVRPGDQIIADGAILNDGRIDVDESLLTGESDQITKRKGDFVMSGSFCVTGEALYSAEKVGMDSYLNKLSAEAKTFQLNTTPLQREINLVLRFLILMASAFGVLFAVSFYFNPVETTEAVKIAAVITGLVPIGLILMTATSYALGAVRMVGSGALVQQSNAVESMSHIDVLCMDKTGTLTANAIEVEQLYPADGQSENTIQQLLGEFSRSVTGGNRTIEALQHAYEGQPRDVNGEVSFSSARKWSGITFSGEQGSSYVLGAPEILEEFLQEAPDEAQLQKWTHKGLRVVIFARADAPLDENTNALPANLQTLAVITLRDTLRPNVQETLDNFRAAGIALKVISGDHPETVFALARQAGMEVTENQLVSGTTIDALDDSQLATLVEETVIFGRITPQQKARIVAALKTNGHYVAMTGDGVNDVPSLKSANISIAMQSGSAAARGVADIILMNDSFSALPAAFMEGQRILNGMTQIVRLFLVRVFSAVFAILAVTVITNTDFFPITPTYDGLFTLLTVGFPTFLLAVWAKPGVTQKNIVARAMNFIIPASLITASFTLVLYFILLAVWYLPAETPVAQAHAIDMARTGFITALISCGILMIAFVKPPTAWWTGGAVLNGDKRTLGLVMLMFITLASVTIVEPLRDFFELEVLNGLAYGLIFAVVVLWMLTLRGFWRNHLYERFLGMDVPES
ncbi:MAG: HAD-IC family P-type ATPase [Aggregatilineales bacterium]